MRRGQSAGFSGAAHAVPGMRRQCSAGAAGARSGAKQVKWDDLRILRSSDPQDPPPEDGGGAEHNERRRLLIIALVAKVSLLLLLQLEED